MESPLTPESRESLEKLRLKFETVSLDRVFSSPRKRAIDTAKFLNEDIEVLNSMEEMDFGLFEGLTYEQIEEQYPEEAEKMMSQAGAYVFPQGESSAGFSQRVRSGIKEVFSVSEKRGYDKIALVSHAGVIRIILSFLLSGDDGLHWNFKVDNARVSKVSCRDGFCVLEYLNG
ncbi:MAG: histidine phosphatase family protein [Filifactor alocis]|nr:histidine phosphatase family protein [Filifactor alocis]